MSAADDIYREAARRYVEAAAAQEPARPPIDIRALLSDAQRAAWDCLSRVIYLLCGRRAGKTWLCAAILLDGALKNPNSLSVYLALSRESARRIVWPAIRDVCLAAGIDMSCLHEHTLTVKLPNGASIVCAGTDDQRTIESWRGTKLLQAVVDECGSQPESFIAYLVGSILRPALMDLRGRLICAGTPGLILKGWWYEQTKDYGEARDTKLPPLFRWTVLDNPAIPHAAEELELEERTAANSATYQREWLAEWIEDAGALVFPIELGRNTTAKLPKRSKTGVHLHSSQWRFVIGVDCGYTDATAIAVLAVHPLDPRVFVCHTEKHGEMLPRQLGERLRMMKGTRWQWCEEPVDSSLASATIVMDTGGLGKPYAEECIRVFRIGVQAAKKTDKEGNIRFVRGDVIGGRLVILDGPQNDALCDEWAVLGWDDDKRLPNQDQEDHASDAVCYAHREIRHYRDTDATRPVEYLSEAWFDEETERMRAGRIAKHNASVNRRALPWE